MFHSGAARFVLLEKFLGETAKYMKQICEIFSDYEIEGNINTAIVQAVVLTKSTKTLEMKISSDQYIEIKEIESLNQFIRERLALNDSIITVVYTEGTDRKPLEEELKNILSLLADKHPVLNRALKNCDYEIAENHRSNLLLKRQFPTY